VRRLADKPAFKRWLKKQRQRQREDAFVPEDFF